VRRLAAVLAVALVTLGATACGSAKPVSVAQVERSFAKHHQTFETEIIAGPSLHTVEPVWPLPGRRAIEPHLLATLTAWDPDTLSGLQAWVFDSAKDARSAQGLAPALADRDVQARVGGQRGEAGLRRPPGEPDRRRQHEPLAGRGEGARRSALKRE
jgi:hypothetical protein